MARPLAAEARALIRLEHLYWLTGALFAGWALLSLFDRNNRKRFGNALFWGLMATSLIGGSHFTDFANGLIVLGMVGIAGFGFMGRSHPKTTGEVERKAFAELRGNKLFLPALIIPFVALAGTLAYNYTPLGQLGWIEPKRETYVFLVLGVLLALLVIGAATAWFLWNALVRVHARMQAALRDLVDKPDQAK